MTQKTSKTVLVLSTACILATLFFFFSKSTIPYHRLPARTFIVTENIKVIQKPHWRCDNEQHTIGKWNYLLDDLLQSREIYNNFDVQSYVEDLEGWNNIGPMFKEALDNLTSAKRVNNAQPLRIIEVGTWKGSSTIKMAQICRKREINCTILAIDTWTGSPAMFLQPKHSLQILMKNNKGLLPIFEIFLKNVKKMNFSDVIIPFRLTSLGAAHVLHCLQLTADFIYIDGDHDYLPVKNDLRAYWPLLKPGGMLFGDDYSAGWPGVQAAVQEHCVEEKIKMTLKDVTWSIMKPIK